MPSMKLDGSGVMLKRLVPLAVSNGDNTNENCDWMSVTLPGIPDKPTTGNRSDPVFEFVGAAVIGETKLANTEPAPLYCAW